MHTIEFKYLPKDPEQKILDAGCGDGRHLQVAQKWNFKNLSGIDLDEESLTKAKNRFNNNYPQLDVGSLENLPYPDNHFDISICSEVLEHVQNVDAALNNLYRTTRKGGICAISVPRFWPEKICWLLSKEYPKTPGGHLRIFKAKKLKKAIEEKGFKIYRTHYAHAFHSPYWWLRCLLWQQQNSNALIKRFENFLVKVMFKYDLKTHPIEKLLNPILGKSLVIYAKK